MASLSDKGIRVLGFAMKDTSIIPKSEEENVEMDLTFLGIVGMIDPPRKEAFDSVKICHDAGIKVVMITGDHLLTAKSIAKDLGIYQERDLALSGNELKKLTDEQLDKIVFFRNILYYY